MGPLVFLRMWWIEVGQAGVCAGGFVP